MPDPEGNITAGGDNVAAPGPTPVAPDIGANVPAGVPIVPPQVGDRTASSITTPPPARPTFFRQLLFSLGKGLIEGTKAGLQAPLNAQGPSIAATTAIQAPQREQERLNQEQLDRLKIETSQVNLAILHHTLANVADERVQGYYKAGQKYANDLIEKGGAEPAGTGTRADIQKLLLQKKDTNPEETYLPFPNPGSSFGDENEYTLLKIDPKGRFDDDSPAQTIKGMTVTMADGQTVQYPDVTLPATKKGTRIDAFTARVTPMLKMAGLQDTDITRLATTAAQQAGAMARTKLTTDVRIKTTAMNNATRRATALLSSQDKETVAAAQLVLKAKDKLADVQGKESDWKDWLGLSTNTKQATAQAADAFNDAVKNMQAITKGKANVSPKPPTITPTGKVPKGTIATTAVMQQYLQRAGGDKAVARTNLTNDGYTIPPRGQGAQ